MSFSKELRNQLQNIKNLVFIILEDKIDLTQTGYPHSSVILIK